ncbi:CsbD family protein [Pseudanabaena sp. FACHB-2040]|nr:CsbD family protein [Pseudanabaena sp. FACHB-2040]
MWGEGSHESVEGKVEETLGSAKRRVGEITDNNEMQTRGAGNELKGRAQYNKGRAESAVEDVREQAEDTTQGIIDNVKDIFR